VAVSDRDPIGDVLALWADELLLEQLGEHSEADAGAQRQQPPSLS
jgi:hypothetical protein